MRRHFRLCLAAALLAYLPMTAHAQTNAAASRAAQRQINSGYSYESYGLGARCNNRPFAPGCDKRGSW